MKCKIKGVKDATDDNKFSNCVCSRFSYILATYQPLGDGIQAIQNTCGWWGVSGELEQTTPAGVEDDAPMRCNVIATNVALFMSKISPGPEAWAHAMAHADRCRAVLTAVFVRPNLNHRRARDRAATRRNP